MRIKIRPHLHFVAHAALIFLAGCHPTGKSEKMIVTQETPQDTISLLKDGSLECEFAEQNKYRNVWICSQYDDRHRLVHQYLLVKESRADKTTTINLIKRVYIGAHLTHETLNREFVEEKEPFLGTFHSVAGEITTQFYYNEFDSLSKKITVKTSHAYGRIDRTTDLFYFNPKGVRTKMTSRDTVVISGQGYGITDTQRIYDSSGRITLMTAHFFDSDDSTKNKDYKIEYVYFKDGSLRNKKSQETYQLGLEPAGGGQVRFTFYPIIETVEETFDRDARGPVRIWKRQHSKVHHKPKGTQTEWNEIVRWKKYEYDRKRRMVVITDKDVSADDHLLHYDVTVVDSIRKIRKVITVFSPSDTSRVKIYGWDDPLHWYPMMEYRDIKKESGFLTFYRYNAMKKRKRIETHLYNHLFESDSSVSYIKTSVMGKNQERQRIFYKGGVIIKRDTSELRED
jgi:hypothetical protein